MFDHGSRYAPLGTATLTLPDGREATYKLRRLLPSSRELPSLAEVSVTQGDRLDLVAARVLGDPEQYWRICDANDAMDPLELVAQVGAVLRVAVPQP